MEDLKKLIVLYPDYPPSAAIWAEIKRIARPPTEELALTKTAQKTLNFLKHETHYQTRARTANRDEIPEPQTVRFYYRDQPYYLDFKLNIYQPDGNTHLTATLCGQINPETQEVTIDDQIVYTIPIITAGKTTVQEKAYYLDTDDPKMTIYQTFHPDPTLNMLFPIGTMPRKGKIDVYEVEPKPNFLKKKSEEEE